MEPGGLLCPTGLAVWLKANHCRSLGRLGLLGSTSEAECSVGRPGAHESPTIVDAKIWVQTLTPARSFQMQNDKMGDTVVLVSGYSEHGVQRAWFLVSVISAHGRRKQGDHREFEASSRVRLSQNDKQLSRLLSW